MEPKALAGKVADRLVSRRPELFVLLAVLALVFFYLDRWTRLVWDAHQTGMATLGKIDQNITRSTATLEALAKSMESAQERREEEHGRMIDSIESLHREQEGRRGR